MYRKIGVMLTAAAVVIGMSGCGGSSSDSSSKDSASKDSKGGLISLITNDPANPFWSAEADAVKAEGKKLGYKVSVTAHKGDTKKESDLVDSAITKGSKAILLDPANANGSIGAVKKIVKADIPVFLVNAEINKQGLAKAQLVSNNAQGAALGAKQFVKAMGGKGKYVELKGPSSDNNSATRSNGYKTVLSQYPKMKLVETQVAGWDQKLGHDKMQSILQAHPDIDGVLSGNDTMALGAIAALKEAGKLDKVVVGGFDGIPDAADAIKAGSQDYTVLQPVVEFSKKAVDEADKYLKTGKTGAPQEKQSFDCSLITKKNIGKYKDFQLK
ncbi:D-ribose ABC transporter substrate-binding protein [Spelaeicoccus albus]|uniref:Erythritol transport system substrate-binding protein n=1 Tax=Spelaeicoccus albus TaxID=1280376 RepID=A0A7Z0D5E6_9MICO|nr:D-ribose ABC transporter substrate-binding protein [Spelaeicoccus albus]NYI69205.1 erythritol transport system substrate-binding protein [Spelaeicoccus albus]